MKNKITFKITIASFFNIDNIEEEYNMEFNKKISVNKPFCLGTENWEEHKKAFKTQRFDKYQNGLTETEKRDKEITEVNSLLSKVENLSLSLYEKGDFHILTKRYIKYLRKSIPETPEQYYNHYVNTKRFLLKAIVTPYDKNEFHSFLETLDNYEKNYRYILNKLDENNSFEFKNNVIDHVTKVRKAQINSVFAIKLDELINHLSKKEEIQINHKPFEFNNNFDFTKSHEIYTHFKVGLVDSKMLTLEELENYIKSAFEKKQPPNTLFIIKNNPSKGSVMKVFYKYYTEVAGKPHGKQKEHAALLGNYFKGYKTDTVSTNFSKSVY